MDANSPELDAASAQSHSGVVGHTGGFCGVGAFAATASQLSAAHLGSLNAAALLSGAVAAAASNGGGGGGGGGSPATNLQLLNGSLLGPASSGVLGGATMNGSGVVGSSMMSPNGGYGGDHCGSLSSQYGALYQHYLASIMSSATGGAAGMSSLLGKDCAAAINSNVSSLATMTATSSPGLYFA